MIQAATTDMNGSTIGWVAGSRFDAGMSRGRTVSVMSPRIREWPAGERPRERLVRLRSDALATRELIAIVLGAGSTGRSAVELAGDLLGRFDGSLRSCCHGSVSH